MLPMSPSMSVSLSATGLATTKPLRWGCELYLCVHEVTDGYLLLCDSIVTACVLSNMCHKNTCFHCKCQRLSTRCGCTHRILVWRNGAEKIINDIVVSKIAINTIKSADDGIKIIRQDWYLFTHDDNTHKILKSDVSGTGCLRQWLN